MLASAFVARHRRTHCRGGDGAAAGREETPPAPSYRLPGRTQRAQGRATQQEGSARSGASGRLPRQRRRAVPLAPRPGTAAPDAGGAEHGPGVAAAETAKASASLVPGASAAEAEEVASVASSAELCAVCLEDLRGEAAAATALPCSHKYHPGCVRPWLAVHRACPCCRAAAPASPLES